MYKYDKSTYMLYNKLSSSLNYKVYANIMYYILSILTADNLFFCIIFPYFFRLVELDIRNSSSIIFMYLLWIYTTYSMYYSIFIIYVKSIAPHI